MENYKILVRFPLSMKKTIEAKAKQEGISINQYIIYKLREDNHDVYCNTNFYCADCGESVYMNGAIGDKVFIEKHDCKTSKKVVKRWF